MIGQRWNSSYNYPALFFGVYSPGMATKTDVRTFTVIDGASPDRRATEVVMFAIDGEVSLSVADLHTALGIERKPEGLCVGDVCYPVRSAIDDVVDGVATVRLSGVAATTGRPLVIDDGATVACLGAGAGERSQSLKSGYAPDFTLPDLSGMTHSLSDFRGRKVVLYAYASW